MRRLLVYQAVWAMEGLPGIDLDADMAGALDRIAEAGFDGVGVNLARTARAEAVSKGMARLGLSWEAMMAVRTPAELEAAARRAVEMGAHHLNVQILERPDRVADAVDLLRRVESVAAEAKLPVRYETHRGRLTNDLLFTLRVLDALPDLRLTGDLSHYPLVHEFPLPVPPQDQARMGRILDHCWAFHGRVGGSHQVQVSVAAPQHQEWVAQFRAWWAQGFASWRVRSGEDDDLSFMCELGPPNYALTDAEGREFADRWTEARILMAMAREVWGEAEATCVAAG